MTPLFLFDFDGVIVDSFQAAFHTARHFYSGLEEETYRGWFEGSIYKRPDTQGWTKEQHELFHDEYFRLYTEKFRGRKPIEGVSEILYTLAPHSIISIVSSGSEPMIREFLSTYRLDSSVSDVLGVESGRDKTEKNNTLLRMYNTPSSEAVFVTDTLGDIEEARASGIESIAVTWGFHERARLEKGNPRAIVDTPAQLKTLLETFL